MELVCECCGFAQTFEAITAARDAGWSMPPYQHHVACPLCPMSLIRLGRTARHALAHLRWVSQGRPQSFTEQFRWGDLPTGRESRDDSAHGS